MVNPPPTKIKPSAWHAIAIISIAFEPRFELKAESNVPSKFNLIKPSAVPTKIELSD
ncbi:hypothetical protein UFOVP1604_286 [uncultured Caudovirales phage]|uniref:Uncharacterized protein n=1 Tax=uncultured Caudovirales phage TaxID=2100421 RepID=A0A6J5SUR0_9CAUD|nr:hypothetical protein UFOVP1604_286 [uncultured Caudovirales phage]